LHVDVVRGQPSAEVSYSVMEEPETLPSERSLQRIARTVADLSYAIQGQPVAHAPPILAAAGIADRCRIQAGSFFESVPAGGDAYVLKYILHDWDDPRAAAILTACRRATSPDGTVLVVERLLPERARSGINTDVYLLDLEMLATTPGGRERTEDEFRQSFAGAGLVLQQVVPTASPFWVLEGRPG
jgi:hypothetical protein